VNIKAIGDEEKDLLEISYYINMKNENKSDQFVRQLKQTDGVAQVNVFFDEE
jgi:hypothetical protein